MELARRYILVAYAAGQADIHTNILRYGKVAEKVKDSTQ